MDEVLNGLMNFVLWIIFWWMVFKAIDAVLAIRKINSESDDIRNNMEQQLNVILHNVKEEMHNGVCYWFDDENDQFLAQGESISDVCEHLKARFKDHIFIVKERFVFVGPDYKGEEVGDEDAIGKYVAKIMLERAGIQVVDK